MTTTTIPIIPMSYSEFTLLQVQQNLNVTVHETVNLFSGVSSFPPSQLLRETLEYNIPLANAINTEKAKSELIIAPVLLEIKRTLTNVSLFSGVDFNVSPEQGLTGYVDFILSKSPEQYFVKSPVFTLVEAKNENIVRGLGQCLAEIFAAALFNKQSNNNIDTIYGVVTTGKEWQFLKLNQHEAHIDVTTYYINEVDKILGILLSMFD